MGGPLSLNFDQKWTIVRRYRVITTCRTMKIFSINLWDKGEGGFCQTMADKLMIHKITPSVDYKYRSKRLVTQLNEQINQNLLKVSMVVKPTNKKTLF